MLDARYADGAPELYAHGISARLVAGVADPASLLAPMARVQAAEGEFVLSDAMGDAGFARGLVDVMRSERSVAGSSGAIVGEGGAALNDAVRSLDNLTVEPLSLESSNTSFIVHGTSGNPAVLKLVRRHDGVIAPGTPSRALERLEGRVPDQRGGLP